jgi:hypothetical protein
MKARQTAEAEFPPLIVADQNKEIRVTSGLSRTPSPMEKALPRRKHDFVR